MPQLPPIDSVSQWTAMLNQSRPARSEIQLSSLAIVVVRGAALYKLVLGAQPYSRWTGDLYPNCSRGETPPGVAAPVLIDLKVRASKHELVPLRRRSLHLDHVCPAATPYPTVIRLPARPRNRSLGRS